MRSWLVVVIVAAWSTQSTGALTAFASTSARIALCGNRDSRRMISLAAQRGGVCGSKVLGGSTGGSTNPTSACSAQGFGRRTGGRRHLGNARGRSVGQSTSSLLDVRAAPRGLGQPPRRGRVARLVNNLRLTAGSCAATHLIRYGAGVAPGHVRQKPSAPSRPGRERTASAPAPQDARF
jgi:hypothetical protein